MTVILDRKYFLSLMTVITHPIILGNNYSGVVVLDMVVIPDIQGKSY